MLMTLLSPESRTSSGLFLSQHKYISDLIHKFHLHTAKPVRTPVVSRTTLSLTDGELLVDSTEYRSMVGAVQYLPMTRPNIAYAVNIVSGLSMLPGLLICRLLRGSYGT